MNTMYTLPKHFPDCLIHDMPQRSEAWHKIRKDKLTASQAGSWLAEEKKCRLENKEIEALLDMASINYKKRSTKSDLLALLQTVADMPLTHSSGTIQARHTAICGILGNLSGCAVPDEWEVDPDGPPPRNPSLWAVWNGIRLEKDAVAAFQKWSGKAVAEVGFCEHNLRSSGCSPDGLIVGEAVGFEGKAPLPATHVRYLLDGVLPEQYKAQVHFSMAVTGAKAWWFQSYCPGMPTFRILAERDEYTERMVEGLAEFDECLTAAREEIESMWDEELEGREV